MTHEYTVWKSQDCWILGMMGAKISHTPVLFVYRPTASGRTLTCAHVLSRDDGCITQIVTCTLRATWLNAGVETAEAL
jgi:hypothetical protein